MKKIGFHIACLVSACFACAASVAQTDMPALDSPSPSIEKAPEITVKVSVRQDFDVSGDKTKPLFVQFIASPKLTEVLRSEFAADGYQLASSREAASVIYELDGAFQALRPATRRTAEIRAGDFAEKPDSLTTKTGRGSSVALSLNPLAMIIGTIVSNVGDATGARDATNATLVGDPDGKCLAKCGGWGYRQRVVVSLTRIESGTPTKAISVASVEATMLEPRALFARSAQELGESVHVPLRALFQE
jgi:hypothetical protein